MVNFPLRVLVLYWYPGKMRPAIEHHLKVLSHSDHPIETIYYNAINGVPTWFQHFDFDAVILHTTLLCMRWSDRFQTWKSKLRWLNNFNCLKIAIPQDEYDHCEILDEWLFELGVSVIFSNFDESYRSILYPIMHSRATFHKCLTGYINSSIAQSYSSKLPAVQDRPYDIVYRASHLPYWFGSQGQLKHRIAEIIDKQAIELGLKCNISTRSNDTIIGKQWFDFLSSGRATIGCESGSSSIDLRGELKTKIQSLLQENPNLSFEETSRLLPKGWDDFKFFAISPRHFEAIITKTCQVLVEGYYDGILLANKHYIPVKKDFSNLEEALKKLKDIDLITQIAENAYQDIYLQGNYTYQDFATEIEQVILENSKGKEPTFTFQKHSRAKFILLQLFTRIYQYLDFFLYKSSKIFLLISRKGLRFKPLKLSKSHSFSSK